MNRLLLVSAICCWHLLRVDSSRIVDSTPQVPSHVLEHVGLLEELVKAGHEVFIVLESKFPDRHRRSFVDKGIRILDFDMPQSEKTFADPAYEKESAEATFLVETDFLNAEDVTTMVARDCIYMMRDSKFLETAKNLKFDLAIVEPFFMESCNLILPHYLNIPFVTLTNQYAPWMVRSPAPLSTYPRHYFDFDLTKMPSLKSRVAIFLLNLAIYVNYPICLRSNTTLLEELKVGVGWDDLLLRSSLFLYEVDYHLAVAMPHYPNHVSVAGLTCKPAKKLDDDLELIMTSNPNGVILMSFGSMGSSIPKHMLEKFFEAFSKLNQTIITRLTLAFDVPVPQNVKILKWLPQNDLLAHDNLRLFITHCGNNGQHEGLYHGVPMLGFPIFAEQKQNCFRAQVKGFGMTMNIRDFTVPELLENIHRILDDNSFSDSVKRMSVIFKSQATTAHERAIFWINHVIRFGGDHLRPTQMDMPIYEILALDVILVICLCLFVIALVVYFSLKFIFKRLFSKNDLKIKKH